MHFIGLYKSYHIVAVFDSGFMHFYHVFYHDLIICILLFYPLLPFKLRFMIYLFFLSMHALFHSTQDL